MSLESIIKFLISFLKLKRYILIVIKSLTKKIIFYLFIKVINVFKSLFLLFHHLKLKKIYIVMLLRNL